MANVSAPNGFQFFGKTEGASPTVGMERRFVSSSAAAIGYGDPVISVSTGYVQIATASTVQIAGIFFGCEYFNTAVGRVVWSKSWPGSGASGDVIAYLDTDPNSLFAAQSDGTAIAFTNIGNNIQLFIGTPATEAAGGFSTSGIHAATIDVTTTLPFRIVDLLSSYVKNQNGTDDTTNYNVAIVRPNYWDRTSQTGI